METLLDNPFIQAWFLWGPLSAFALIMFLHWLEGVRGPLPWSTRRARRKYRGIATEDDLRKKFGDPLCEVRTEEGRNLVYSRKRIGAEAVLVGEDGTVLACGITRDPRLWKPTI